MDEYSTAGQIMYWLVMLALYLYQGYAFLIIAKRTGTANGWMAFIPILNVFLMLRIAKKPLWWFLLLLVPLINIIFNFVAYWTGKISE